VTYGFSFAPMFAAMGVSGDVEGVLSDIVNMTTATLAPVLPYLLLVLMLIFRPRGLFGTRDV